MERLLHCQEPSLLIQLWHWCHSSLSPLAVYQYLSKHILTHSKKKNSEVVQTLNLHKWTKMFIPRCYRPCANKLLSKEFVCKLLLNAFAVCSVTPHCSIAPLKSEAPITMKWSIIYSTLTEEMQMHVHCTWMASKEICNTFTICKKVAIGFFSHWLLHSSSTQQATTLNKV